jgi:hypothetical protein
MANPFKEAEKAKKVAPGSHKQTVVEKTEEKVASVAPEAPVEKVDPVVEETPVAPVKEEPVTPQPKAEKKPAKTANKIDALLGPAQKAKKQERSTIAVYLSKENQAWLKDLANQRGKSVSELLDQILNELRG